VRIAFVAVAIAVNDHVNGHDDVRRRSRTPLEIDGES
jgi:hypothetical protein